MTPPVLATRDYCYTCFKPAQLCVCGIERVRNRTRVVILQHPRERQHPLGTERFARLGLESCDVQIAWGVSVTPESVPADAALLFPSDDAIEINTLSAETRPKTLIAIDGTWSQARSLYKRNPWLATLPHVKLTQAPPSNYRIRREPRAHYVSTIEAVVHALRVLEPETPGFDSLLGHFDRMIDRQLEFSKRPPEGSYRHTRRKARTLHPHPLFRDRSRTPVVAYAEYIAKADGLAVIQVALQRLDGERVEGFIRESADAPDPLHLDNMKLTRAQISDGVSFDVLRDALRAFVRSTDFLVAWSPSTLRILQSMAPWPDELVLKGAYGNYTRSRPGELEEIPTRHAITVGESFFSGRAGQRMSAALAVTRWMWSRAVTQS